MKLQEIIYEKDCYVYSTSYRFCISAFAFAPSTTVGPMDGDISKAINITWHRRVRNMLPSLHSEVCEAARKWGLDRLHRLAVLTFAYPKGRPRDGLECLADGARLARDDFPFLTTTIVFMRSFVPTKWPTANQLQEARTVWVKGIEHATSVDRKTNKTGEASGKEVLTSEVPQEELDREVGIKPEEFLGLFQISSHIHKGINDWLNPPSGVTPKSGIDLRDNLIAQLPKLLSELTALRDRIQEIWDRSGFDYKIIDPKIPRDQIRVKCGELLSLAQMRAQISNELNQWMHPERIVPKEGQDKLGHLINRTDIITQALTSIRATLDEIKERNLGETAE
jgi:hypothetical protein